LHEKTKSDLYNQNLMYKDDFIRHISKLWTIIKDDKTKNEI
jgi:hypothetical protein